MQWPIAEILLCVLVLGVCGVRDVPPKRYTVSLDAPPTERWSHVMRDNIDVVPLIIEEAKKLIPSVLRRPIFWLAEKALSHFPEDYAAELEGIASVTGLPLGEVVGINILYDITDFKRNIFPSFPQLACTSIVAEDAKGRIIHARNLDYEMGALLRKATVLVDFARDGKLLFTAPTFLIMVGVLTGQRPDAFSVSLNARYSGGIWDNIFMEIITRFRHPISFEIRRALEEVTHFDDAVTRLSAEHFIAPAYIIIGGMRSGEGAIVTRNRWSAADVYRLDVGKGRWFLLETNYDYWKKAGDPRRRMGIRYMNDVGQSNISPQTIYGVISKEPVLANLTIFSTIMSAARSRLIYDFTQVRYITP